MRYPRVTVIVLNFNGLQDSRTCIKSLLKTTYPKLHIIVADNGSKMNEAHILKKEFKNKSLTFVRFNKNYGFSGGNNILMRKIKDPYIALVNNDVIVKPGWLKPIIALMEKHKEIAVVQPKILWAYDRRYFDYAGAAGGFIDYLGYPFTRGRIFTSLEADRGQYDRSLDIFWASGATMAIRRQVLNQVGFFDEAFFNYMEEIDLCYRILQKGYRVVYEPRSVVYHKVASTASRHSSQKRFLEHRNNLLLVAKNFPVLKFVVLLPLRIFMEGVSVFYYIAIARPDFALAVTGSLLSFLFLLPKYIIERMSDPKEDTARIKRLMYPRSIVFDYFILKKKTFQNMIKLARWKLPYPHK